MSAVLLTMTVPQIETLGKEALKLRKIFDDFMSPKKAAKVSRVTTAQRRKAERISRLIEAHFEEGHRKAISYLFAEALEIDPKAFGIKPDPEKLPMIPGLCEHDNDVPRYTALVILSCIYESIPLNEVVFMFNPHSNYVMTKECGLPDKSINISSGVYSERWRFATPDEIRKTIAHMKTVTKSRVGAGGVGW